MKYRYSFDDFIDKIIKTWINFAFVYEIWYICFILNKISLK